jgi:hypothetical protein
MSLYREPGRRRPALIAAAAALALLVGIGGGIEIGRVTADSPSLSSQLAQLRENLGGVRDALEQTSIEYGQASQPTEYEAAAESIQRAQSRFDSLRADLDAVGPEEGRAAAAALAAIVQQVSDRAPAADVTAAVDRLETQLEDAV